jgi:hypothetical protein
MAKPPRSGGSAADVLYLSRQENRIAYVFGQSIAFTKDIKDKRCVGSSLC